jgi:hypothetical protein
MNLMLFTGLMGSGKTLGMSLIAKRYQEQTGCTLYSNYGLKGSKPFTSFYDFLDVAVQPSSIVCLDEVHNDIDSRDFNTNAVKYFSHIVFYLRKMRCMLFMTTPLFENVESRVRNVTSVVVPVQKDKDYFYYPFIDAHTEVLLKQWKIKKDTAFKASKTLYDTYSMVTPLEYPANRDEFKKLLHELRVRNDRYLEGLAGAGGTPATAKPDKEGAIIYA